MKKYFLFFIIMILFFKATPNKKDSLINIIKNGHDTMKVKSLNDLGVYLFTNEGKVKEASECFYNAEKKAKHIGYNRGLAACYTLLSILYNSNHNNDSVFKYCNLSINIYRELNDTLRANYFTNIFNLADTYAKMGVLNKSIELFLSGLRISEFSDNYYNKIRFNQEIALFYSNKSEYTKSIKYYKKAISIVKKEDSLNYFSFLYRGLGNDLSNIKEFDKSLSYLKRSLNISLFANDSIGISYAYIGIGKNYKSQNIFDSALKYLNKSLIFKDPVINAETYLYLGEVFTSLKKYNLAYTYLNKCLKIIKPLELKDFVCYNYKKLYQLDSITNNNSDYIENYKLYKSYSDSLYNLESEKKIVASELNFKFDKEKLLLKLKQEQKDKLDKLESKRKNILIAFIGVVVLLLIIFLVSKNKANKIISHQKQLVEEKHKEIKDNITYAQRIQSSILPKEVTKLADNFVLYKPKDIVSGDFYWSSESDLENELYLCVADCTGHGVSGAMMSMLNISTLNELVNVKWLSDTGVILNSVRKKIIKSLNPIGNEGVNDGMDCVIGKFNFENKTLQYSAANNSFYIVRNNELIVCKADKMPVGLGMKNDDFKSTTIQLMSGDMVYMFTDGYADQFGGKENKKFKYKQLEDLFLRINSFGLDEQRKILNDTFIDWMGSNEQTDDVLIVGIKI